MPTPAKRRFIGGTPAVHYALVNGDPAIAWRQREPEAPLIAQW